MMMISSEVPLGVRSPNETVDSAAPASLLPCHHIEDIKG